MSAAPKVRQPWQMKWIVLAIVIVLVPYTFLTLHYRKSGPAFRPYEDMKNRADVIRLLSAGYQRIPLMAQRPADPTGAAPAAVSPAPGGLPQELRTTLVDAPLLPAEIVSVAAAATASAADQYPIRFSCTLPDDRQQLAGAELYIKGTQIVITPTFERLSGQLLTRTLDNVVLITVPPGALKPGRYQVTLTGQRSSRSWSLQLK
ncbi:MAG: hypothetical protein EXS38_08195 [Opitutus sp.]|nr:hypothetical protein [Opitutus sp.]